MCVEYLFVLFNIQVHFHWIKGEHLFLFLKAFGKCVYSYFAESFNFICVHTFLLNNNKLPMAN